MGWAWYSLRVSRSLLAEQLISKAYSNRRPFNYRIPGAKYGPVRTTRSETSIAAKSADLFDALELLELDIARQPDDPKLLEVLGRAQILALELSAAEESLKKAFAMKPSDPAIGTDLAVLEALRSETAGDPKLALKALGLLDAMLCCNVSCPVETIIARQNAYLQTVCDQECLW